MYKHLFFDLDRTLWDFEKNSHEVLNELFEEHQLHNKGIERAQDFIQTYKTINEQLWNLYRQNKIKKEQLRDQRFHMTLEHFGISNKDLSAKLGQKYVELCPKKTHLFPFVHAILTKLQDNYQLHIITNGFEEVQYQKLTANNLLSYFNFIITSEQAGCKKPNADIFNYSFQKTQSTPQNSLMIGDDLVADIAGAREVGMDQVFFNPHGVQHADTQITFEINCLSELNKLL